MTKLVDENECEVKLLKFLHEKYCLVRPQILGGLEKQSLTKEA